MYVDLCSQIRKIRNENSDKSDYYNSLQLAIISGALCTPETIMNFKNMFNCTVIVSSKTEASKFLLFVIIAYKKK